MKKAIFIIFIGLFVVGCAISPNGQKSNANMLENSSWILTGISNETLNLKKAPTIQFLQNRAAGFNSVNNFSANYKLANNKLILSDMITTRMAALSPELSKIEEMFINTLSNISSFELEDDFLSIYGANNILIFKKIK